MHRSGGGGGDLENLRARQADLSARQSRQSAPAGLAMRLVCESGKVASLLQWRTDERAALSEGERSRLSRDLSGVVLAAIGLADRCGIDLGDAALRRLRRQCPAVQSPAARKASAASAPPAALDRNSTAPTDSQLSLSAYLPPARPAATLPSPELSPRVPDHADSNSSLASHSTVWSAQPSPPLSPLSPRTVQTDFFPMLEALESTAFTSEEFDELNLTFCIPSISVRGLPGVLHHHSDEKFIDLKPRGRFIPVRLSDRQQLVSLAREARRRLLQGQPATAQHDHNGALEGRSQTEPAPQGLVPRCSSGVSHHSV
eukprot:TRINITY_DN4528_c0_g2_i3.p1 TRINITY_DN4528_c0_g2~~TRINITY_DN4528_c0_g2_i3.p1  ORF type:complete len:315 (+),score=96.18 TRINITY_DN4528_c0_g2_i3:174-1118(+)